MDLISFHPYQGLPSHSLPRLFLSFILNFLFSPLALSLLFPITTFFWFLKLISYGRLLQRSLFFLPSSYFWLLSLSTLIDTNGMFNCFEDGSMVVKSFWVWMGLDDFLVYLIAWVFWFSEFFEFVWFTGFKWFLSFFFFLIWLVKC